MPPKGARGCLFIHNTGKGRKVDRRLASGRTHDELAQLRRQTFSRMLPERLACKPEARLIRAHPRACATAQQYTQKCILPHGRGLLAYTVSYVRTGWQAWAGRQA